MKIVVDSSSNLYELAGADFAPVSLKIITSEKEYVDDKKLNIHGMLTDLLAYKGKSGTACPSVGDWLSAFGDAKEIIGISLTGKLSGCYNAAMIAAETYTSENPDAKVFILDSLSTGPELELLAEKAAELSRAGLSFENIVEKLQAYHQHTSLAFMLGSLDNFAKNGRVNPALAKLVGMLNIRIVGRASAVGDLEPQDKCRGDKKSIVQIYKNMCASGYIGGRVRITHTENPAAAEDLMKLIQADYPNADIKLGENKGLCSFYAERSGVLVGYEGNAPQLEAGLIKKVSDRISAKNDSVYEEKYD